MGTASAFSIPTASAWGGRVSLHCNAIINGKCLRFVGVAGTARDKVSSPLNRASLMEEGSARLCFPFLSRAPVTDSVSFVRVSVSGLSLKRPFRDPAVGIRCTAERAVSINAVTACCPGGIPWAHRRVRLLSARARIRLLSCGCQGCAHPSFGSSAVRACVVTCACV